MKESIKNIIRFGLIQYALTDDPEGNYQRVKRLMIRLSAQKPDFVVLPEMWLGGPRFPRERPFWASVYERKWEFLRDFCRDSGSGLFFSQLEAAGGKYYNTAWCIDSKGRVKGKFRKMHLFRLGGEDKLYAPGRDFKPFQSRWGKMGFVVCYDIRFPELIRCMADKGIKILIVCAQWPEARADHWMTLLKARAIENQIYVVAVNRLGKKGKESYSGGSVVFDPWGRRICHLPASRTIGLGKVDLSMVERIRRDYPFFKDRR